MDDLFQSDLTLRARIDDLQTLVDEFKEASDMLASELIRLGVDVQAEMALTKWSSVLANNGYGWQELLSSIEGGVIKIDF
ncbi:MAG: hypothetical protein KZQ73_14445 [Candidatus Thiodiazotropha sp. (ex Semelilucina semeliformis)]|nr:hypothetical protein [Candidatus Thiodiazotropha sp. (ex Semelilucina semeliformis)]